MGFAAKCKQVLPIIVLCVGSVMVASPAAAVTYVNVIPTHSTSRVFTGPAVSFGSLRAGSPWGPGSDASDLNHLTDGFQPEGTQWNFQSAWWDADSSIPGGGNGDIEITLDAVYDFSKFVIQADDNDGYALDYWDGSAWQLAHDFGSLASFGLRTRPEAVFGSPIATDKLRIRAYGGDNYFAVSEIQGFVASSAVPEPESWALMILGFGALGAALRHRGRGRLARVY